MLQKIETVQSATGIASSLPERFVLREERFAHAGVTLDITLPRAADELLDEEAFEKDERMPYWADLWPSAKALSRYVLDHAPFTGRVIELGCGLALPSLTLKSQGVDVIATDHNTDALMFARVNAHRNGLGDLNVALFDWRDERINFGRFDVAIAADVLYEQRNATALVALLPRVLTAGGTFILADPGRRWAGEFKRRMRQINWTESDLGLIEEAQTGSSVPSRIQITEWTPASPA